MENLLCLTLGDFGENTYIVDHGNGLFIIDPGDRADLIQQAVEKFNKVPDTVFLTHGHMDHVGALVQVKKLYPSINICINQKEKEYLGKGSYDFQFDDFDSSGMGFFVRKMLPHGEDLPEADTFYKDGDIFFNDWKVIESPGHTAGSSCLYNEKEKLLFSGDTLFWCSYGRTDLHGGSDVQMEESLKKLSLLPPDTRVFPGHGKKDFLLKDNFFPF